MNLIKRMFLIVSILFYAELASAAADCPCFNMGFLQTVFTDKFHTQCNIYKDRDVIYRIEIQHNKYTASSTVTGCILNTEFHDIFENFQTNSMEEHKSCVRAILDACKGLKESMFLKDE